MNSKRQRPLVAFFAAILTTVVMSACTNSSSERADLGAVEQAQADSIKAAAEAEAAEEVFASEKNAKGSKTRGVASLKKSSKSIQKESIFIVQVGTFKVEENAKKIAEKLKSAGLPVVQKKIERENGVVLYAVRFEPTPNRVEADKFASSVKTNTGESPIILSVGN